jgi:hypothetical protein
MSLVPLIYTIIFYSHFIRKLFFHERDTPSWLSPLKKLEELLGRDHQWMKAMQGTGGLRDDDDDDGEHDSGDNDNDKDAERQEEGGGETQQEEATVDGNGSSLGDNYTHDEEQGHSVLSEPEPEPESDDPSPRSPRHMVNIEHERDSECAPRGTQSSLPPPNLYRFNRQRKRWATVKVDLDKIDSPMKQRRGSLDITNLLQERGGEFDFSRDYTPPVRFTSQVCASDDCPCLHRCLPTH